MARLERAYEERDSRVIFLAVDPILDCAGSDPRRGHGVKVVSEVAAAHSGRFALCRTGSGCVAALELPLAETGLARAA